MSFTRRTGGVGFPWRGSAGRRDARTSARSDYTTKSRVRRERTGWRDQALSERHRNYGFDCPMLDLDFVAVEYDTGTPVCLVEYKAGSPRPLDLQHPSYQALRKLADASRTPFAVVFYDPTFWYFTIFPANSRAQEWFDSGETLTELEYVTRLYELRGRSLPPDLVFRLNDVKAENLSAAAAAEEEAADDGA